MDCVSRNLDFAPKAEVSQGTMHVVDKQSHRCVLSPLLTNSIILSQFKI